MLDLIAAHHPASRLMTRVDILAALEAVLSRLKACGWMITGVPMPGQDLRPHILALRWPAAWEARYFRERLWIKDPFMSLALGARSLIFANCMSEQGLISSEGHAFLLEAKLAGVQDRLVIPCVRSGRYQVLVIPHFEARPDKDDLFLAAGLITRLIDRLHELEPAINHRQGQLTQREREVVFHTSFGKTSNEIADELGITARTVFAHLTSAGEKLQATNKTETVVNAFRYNQIPI